MEGGGREAGTQEGIGEEKVRGESGKHQSGEIRHKVPGGSNF